MSNMQLKISRLFKIKVVQKVVSLGSIKYQSHSNEQKTRSKTVFF